MLKGTLKKSDVLHLAQLANLQITEAEIAKLSVQLDETISYVENLQELDTQNVQIEVKTSTEESVGFKDGEKNRRLLPQQVALENSQRKKGNYFVVSRVI